MDSNTSSLSPKTREMPGGFVYIKDIAPFVVLDIRYCGSDNFVGSRIDGYNSPAAILSKEATEAFRKANDCFNKMGYTVKRIYCSITSFFCCEYGYPSSEGNMRYIA